MDNFQLFLNYSLLESSVALWYHSGLEENSLNQMAPGFWHYEIIILLLFSVYLHGHSHLFIPQYANCSSLEPFWYSGFNLLKDKKTCNSICVWMSDKVNRAWLRVSGTVYMDLAQLHVFLSRRNTFLLLMSSLLGSYVSRMMAFMELEHYCIDAILYGT